MTEYYHGTPGKPRAVLVDIDGTIAHNDGHRGFFDWSKVWDDKPHADIIELVRCLWHADYEIVFVSGRSEECFNQTYAWIKEQVFEEEPVAFCLFMRTKAEAEQGIKDSIVKLKIFDEEIRDNFDVWFCLDDRNQVVDAYRSIGLRVLQVAPGNF